MKTNFSNGEWVVTQTDRVECNNEIVALVYDGTAAPTERENIDYVTANANLVSAAPDMFNALRDLYDDREVWSDLFESQQEFICRVLNKATGSSFFKH